MKAALSMDAGRRMSFLLWKEKEMEKATRIHTHKRTRAHTHAHLHTHTHTESQPSKTVLCNFWQGQVNTVRCSFVCFPVFLFVLGGVAVKSNLNLTAQRNTFGRTSGCTKHGCLGSNTKMISKKKANMILSLGLFVFLWLFFCLLFFFFCTALSGRSAEAAGRELTSNFALRDHHWSPPSREESWGGRPEEKADARERAAEREGKRRKDRASD